MQERPGSGFPARHAASPAVRRWRSALRPARPIARAEGDAIQLRRKGSADVAQLSLSLAAREQLAAAEFTQAKFPIVAGASHEPTVAGDRQVVFRVQLDAPCERTVCARPRDTYLAVRRRLPASRRRRRKRNCRIDWLRKGSPSVHTSCGCSAPGDVATKQIASVSDVEQSHRIHRPPRCRVKSPVAGDCSRRQSQRQTKAIGQRMDFPPADDQSLTVESFAVRRYFANSLAFFTIPRLVS